MSHNLTQPEEIDQALMEMSGQNGGVGTPVTGGVQPGEAIQDAECDEF
jgi:hypothetical protein